MSKQEPAEGGFDKARHEYCAKLYEREAERKETLEKKAQFYLSLVTLLLGAIFFKLEFLKGLRELVKNYSGLANLLIQVSTVVLGFGLVYTLIMVLGSMRLQSYKNEHPANIVTSLFSPDSDYMDTETAGGLYKAVAMSYALAVETNKRVNDKKAAWVKRASYGVFVSATALAAFLATITWIYLTKG